MSDSIPLTLFAACAGFLAACGSRTTLGELPLASHDSGAPLDATEGRDADAEGESPSDATSPPDANVSVACPSALLEGAPRPMLANCSTRDGRSRVVGPTSPHVTWSAHVIQDPSGQSSFFGLAADASGGAYLVVGDGDSNFGSFVRVDGASGHVDWRTPFTPMPPDYGAPLLLATGLVELFASNDARTGAAIDSFDIDSGVSTSTSLLPALAFVSGDPAVGTDGSLYAVHKTSAGSSDSVISRISASGSPVWTSSPLASLLPPSVVGSADVIGSTLALGSGDLVLMPLQIVAMNQPARSFLLALDPTTGAARWAEPLQGPIIGGPAVAPSGSIVVLLGPPVFSTTGPAPTSLVVFDPAGTRKLDVAMGRTVTAGLLAVATDGSALIGTQSSPSAIGYEALVAIDGGGKPRWSIATNGLLSVTIDVAGTVVAISSDAVQGLDPSDGHLLWAIAPLGGASFLDATLTSFGGIVAEQSDGVVLGASD
jgi:outer membrane protein assembly factor BamB